MCREWKRKGTQKRSKWNEGLKPNYLYIYYYDLKPSVFKNIA